MPSLPWSLKVVNRWSEFLFTKRQNFSPDQFESTCRQQNKCDWKNIICSGKGKKHSGNSEKEKMLVTAFPPFPTMFSNLSKTNFKFWVTFILSSANALNLDQSKLLLFGKELRHVHSIRHSKTDDMSDLPTWKSVCGPIDGICLWQHFLLFTQCF